jgi:ribokinase
MTRFDVVGFGALNVDRLYKVTRIAHAEEESRIESQTEACGGSAANTVVGLARLGCKVGFIGKIAADREGDMHLSDFGREKVDTAGVIRTSSPGKSGVVFGFVDKEGARALYINSGVNDVIALGEINPAYVGDTRFLHLTSFVGEKSFQAQKALLNKLPGSVRVSFDPGALYARKGLELLQPILKKTYVAMPNRGELELITGHTDYTKGADALIAEGVKVVAVKLGAEGCYVTNGRERHRVEAFKVKAVDTTGAGDAFCAGFIYGLLQNKGPRVSGLIGNFVASRCVTKLGARAGLPYAADLKFLGKMVE